MSSISDIIEEFILKNMTQDEELELSRNDLAKFFSCVPSQINYVLNTRFTVNRGYVVESVRGGSGFIKVIKVSNKDQNLNNILSLCEKPLSTVDAGQILDNLANQKFITKNESMLLKQAVSPKSLNNPLNMDNIIRSNILKEVIIEVMKRS